MGAIGLCEEHLGHAADRNAIQHIIALERFLKLFFHDAAKRGPPRKVAYSKGMRAPVAIACALLVSAGAAHADRRPVAIIDLSGEEAGKDLVEKLSNILANHLDLQRMPAQFEVWLKG